MEQPPGHTPVLPGDVSELLAVRPGAVVVDATLGLAGHALRFAEAMGADGHLIGLDVDPSNLEKGRRALAGAVCRVELRHANFSQIRSTLEGLGVARVDVIFADLGVSSTQLADAERGFSFQRDGPLDMRMDPRLTTTAADLVNRLKERELGDLIYHHAQEFGARKIARRLCQIRREGRITTTKSLADAVCGALHVHPSSRKAKTHPATRTFLALRMAVNQETAALEALLRVAPELLNPGGRIGVIAFHSGEDRVVKTDFRQRRNDKLYDVITKKPVVASAEERSANPRSRSAKLRVAMRLGYEGVEERLCRDQPRR